MRKHGRKFTLHVDPRKHDLGVVYRHLHQQTYRKLGIITIRKKIELFYPIKIFIDFPIQLIAKSQSYSLSTLYLKKNPPSFSNTYHLSVINVSRYILNKNIRN